MALTIKENTKIAVMEEVTEGTYVAPASGTDFIGVLADGAELSPAKELLERNILTGSIGKVAPRTGQRSVAGNIGVELKAGSTAGAAPEYEPFMKAALGASRGRATVTTTKSSGNTGSVLHIENADIDDFAVGDIVMVKQAGAYHVSPITAVVTTTDAATITLLVPKASGSFANSVVIAPFKTYHTANSGHPSLSVSKYVEDAVLEKAIGCRVSSMAMEGFSTGQLPTMKFGVEGLTFDRALSAPAYTPSFDTSLPPVILNAKVYVAGSEVEVNEVTFSVENVLAFATSTASANGRISGRVASRTVTGSMNPYKQDDSIANFTKFTSNTLFSVFGYAYNPTGVAGEFNEVVAYYMPKCLITELAEGDADGLLQDSITFSASRGTGSDEELYVGMS